MAIDDAIYAQAASHAGLQALIGTPPRLYPATAPQNAVAPYVVVQQISGVRVHAMGADPGVAHPRFQFTAWALTDTAAKAVAVQVMACYSRWRGTVAGTEVLDCFLENELGLGLDPDAKLYQRVVDFLLWHRE